MVGYFFMVHFKNISLKWLRVINADKSFEI
jgi:hypothetical protein